MYVLNQNSSYYLRHILHDKVYFNFFRLHDGSNFKAKLMFLQTTCVTKANRLWTQRTLDFPILRMKFIYLGCDEIVPYAVVHVKEITISQNCVSLNFSFTALGSVEESWFKSRKKFLYEELLKEENIYSNRFRIMFKRKNNNPSNLICPKDLTALDKTKPRPPQNSKYCKWNNETVPNIF